MSILEEMLSSLKSLSETQNIHKSGGFSAGMSIIKKGVEMAEVVARIEGVLEKYSQKGEKIIARLDEGEIVDSGKRYFRILGGSVIEFYEYESTTSIFIRSYRISDGKKEWIAVYIDQNPETPWWEH